MARKQPIPIEFEQPENSSTQSSVETASTKTRRARARTQPERNLRQYFRLWVLWSAGVAGAAILMMALYQVDHFLASSPRFFLTGDPEAVDNPNFRVYGLRYTPRDRMTRVFDVDFGRSVYLMPLAERRAQLLNIDWIRDASITRLWPNRIIVSATERKPVAFVALASDIALIDASGVILTLPEKANFQLPVLTGITRTQSPALRRERVQMMLELLKQVGEVASQISEIDVADHRDLQVTLASGMRAFRLHLGNRNYAARLRNFFAHYDEIGTRLPSATVFDLRLDDRITAMEATPNGN